MDENTKPKVIKKNKLTQKSGSQKKKTGKIKNHRKKSTNTKQNSTKKDNTKKVENEAYNVNSSKVEIIPKKKKRKKPHKNKEIVEKIQNDLDAKTKPIANNILFVCNLPYSATEEQIREVFPKSIEIVIPKNKRDYSRGIAFVKFAKDKHAAQSLKKMNNKVFHGRTLKINYRYEREAKVSRILMVRDLALDITPEDLETNFMNAEFIRIIEKKNGASAGCAFIKYRTIDEAIVAKSKLDGKVINDCELKIIYADAEEFKKQESHKKFRLPKY